MTRSADDRVDLGLSADTLVPDLVVRTELDERVADAVVFRTRLRRSESSTDDVRAAALHSEAPLEDENGVDDDS